MPRNLEYEAENSASKREKRQRKRGIEYVMPDLHLMPRGY